MDIYVLDACSLIAFFEEESGFDKVKNLLLKASRGECQIFINKINFLEIYYGFFRDDGIEIAEKTFNNILALPITIVDILTDDVFKEAGKLKSLYRISIADSIALAEAKTRNGLLVTTDHHEFDPIDKSHEVKFFWVR